jgi:hypothetical protein
VREFAADVRTVVEEETAAAVPTCPTCGTPLRRRGRRKRRVLLAHQVDPLEVEREYWYCPACGVGVSPLDEALGLVPGELSPALLETMVRLGAKRSFAEAAEEVGRLCGVWVSEDTVRRCTEAAGRALVALQEDEVTQLEAERPEPPPGSALQQMSADGAMVPLIHGA